MRKIYFTIVIILFISCKKEKEQVMVFELKKCEDFQENLITPQLMEKSPGRYLGECFIWIGKVYDLTESGNEMVYILEEGLFEDFDDDIEISYKSRVSIGFENDGSTDPYRKNVGYKDVYFPNFLYSFETTDIQTGEEIFKGDEVLIKGELLGTWERKLDGGGFEYYPIFILHWMKKFTRK